MEERKYALIQAYLWLSLALGPVSVLIHRERMGNGLVPIFVFFWLVWVKGVIASPWLASISNTKYETRIKTTGMALVIVGALAVWMLGAAYA